MSENTYGQQGVVEGTLLGEHGGSACKQSLHEGVHAAARTGRPELKISRVCLIAFDGSTTILFYWFNDRRRRSKVSLDEYRNVEYE